MANAISRVTARIAMRAAAPSCHASWSSAPTLPEHGQDNCCHANGIVYTGDMLSLSDLRCWQAHSRQAGSSPVGDIPPSMHVYTALPASVNRTYRLAAFAPGSGSTLMTSRLLLWKAILSAIMVFMRWCSNRTARVRSLSVLGTPSLLCCNLFKAATRLPSWLTLPLLPACPIKGLHS
jgi:hypothetical protein